MRTIGLWKRAIPAILILATVAATAEAQLGRKYALLVGVKQYRKSELRDLPFSEPDVTALADVLRDAGYFRVVLMTQTEGAKDARFLPTSENIRISLKGILDQRGADDSVLLAFAGHGVQFRGSEKAEAFFCPMDARLNDKNTLISFSEVYNELGKSTAGFKLLLVDACRNQPAASVTRAREVVDVPSVTRPPSNRPKGLAAFYSCSSGQVAFESEQLRHGVFFHFVLESLRGKGDLNRNGLVELEEMALYTKTNVWDHVKIEYGDDVEQMPELVAESSGVVPLIKLAKLEPVEPPPPLPNAQITATLKSDNGLVEIGLPKGWTQQTGLNEQANLQAGKPEDESYVIVLTEAKADFNPPITIEKHSELTRKFITDSLKDLKLTGPKVMQVGGLQGVQYEIAGKYNDLDVIYLHTTIEGQSHFHQVLTWTLPNFHAKSRPLMEAVIASFREDTTPGRTPLQGAPTVSTDGISQVMLPSGWFTQTGLNEQAQLQVADPANDAYLLVISESKSDFTPAISLDQHSDLTRPHITKSLKNLKVTGPKRMTIGGRSALQYEIHGTYPGEGGDLDVIYLHTTIEGVEHYHQLLTWTLPASHAKSRPTMDAVVASFREIPQAVQPPPIQGTPIASSDGLSQVTVPPGGWARQTDLNAQAQLQIADTANEAYLLVITEKKSDFDPPISVDQHSDMTRPHIINALKNSRVSAKKVMVIGGRNAVQYEIQGTYPGEGGDLDVIYLHTTIEGRDHFHQVLAWTLPAHIDRNRRTLEGVIGSFREVLTRSSGTVVGSTDGNSQVTVPAGWVEMKDLNDQAQLQVGDGERDSYLIVISEPKTDFPGMTIDDHSEVTRGLLVKGLKNVQTSPTTRRLTINGQSAVQYEIRATYSDATTGDLDITYLHTTVEGRTHYHQVLAWTTKDRFGQNASQLNEVIASFLESKLVLHLDPRGI